MANRAGTGRSSSKKNIKNSVILNSEETMRKMDIFGDTLFGKEKGVEEATETASFETAENENITEKMEEIVPIQEEKIDDLDFENDDFSETQSTPEEEVNNIEEIAQNSDDISLAKEVAPIEEPMEIQKSDESIDDPSIEEVAMDDILSMIDEENEQETKTEEPIGSMNLNSDIEQNSIEEIPVSEPVEEVSSPSSNLSDFSSEILGNVSSNVENVVTENVTTFSNEETSQGGMKIEDLLIGDSLLEMMQNADVDVTAIERTEGREALKMIGEE